KGIPEAIRPLGLRPPPGSQTVFGSSADRPLARLLGSRMSGLGCSLARMFLWRSGLRRCACRRVLSSNFELPQGSRRFAFGLLSRLDVNVGSTEAGGVLHSLLQLARIIRFLANNHQLKREAIVVSQLRLHRIQEGAVRHDFLQIVEKLRPGKVSLRKLSVPEVLLQRHITIRGKVFSGDQSVALLLQCRDS